MRTKLFILFLCLPFVACSKHGGWVNMNLLNQGGWDEDYRDYPELAVDGSAHFYFDTSEDTFPEVSAPGKVLVTSYDWLSNTGTKTTYDYSLDGKTITIEQEWGAESYDIVQLTKDEMSWQRVGTKYKQNVGSDFRNFIRIKTED